MTAAAPSFIPELFPAVITPSDLKTGLNLASVFTVVSGRGPSSASTMISPLYPLTKTGIISSIKFPFEIAAEALF